MNLLWTDLETTCLDERSGLLLELGLIITGPHFVERASFSIVVGYPDIRSRIRDPLVRQMHEANGLLDEVERSHVTLADAEAEALAWVRRHNAADWPMAGSSPRFDRRWLREHMPMLAGRYHHRLIDATTIRILFGFEKPVTNHRALTDLRNALNMMRELDTTSIRPLLAESA